MTQAEFLLRCSMLTKCPHGHPCRGRAYHLGANKLGISDAALDSDTRLHCFTCMEVLLRLEGGNDSRNFEGEKFTAPYRRVQLGKLGNRLFLTT
jgi:hypothetical protein